MVMMPDDLQHAIQAWTAILDLSMLTWSRQTVMMNSDAYEHLHATHDIAILLYWAIFVRDGVASYRLPAHTLLIR